MPWLGNYKVHLKKLKTISSIVLDMSPSFELSLSYPLANAIVYSNDTEGKHNPIIFFTTFSPLRMTRNQPLADIIDKHSGNGQRTAIFALSL